MRNILKHIHQSLALKLGLGILLMAVPIFLLSLGFLFLESKNNLKDESMKHANSVLNTTMQRIHRYMNIVETATNINDWEILENLDPDSILSISHYIVALNGHIDGCSISTEPNVFPKFGRYFSAYTVRETDTISTVIEEEYEYFEKVWYEKPRLLEKPCWVVYYDESDSLALTLDGMIASYSKPLYNADKDFVGVISTDLSLIRLSKVITAEKPYEDSYFMMTGEEGRYYLHPDTTQLFTHTIFSDADPNKNPDIFALGHEMTAGHKGNMEVVIDGKPCLVCYEPVAGTSWSVALVCPLSSVLKSYNRLNYVLLSLTVIGLILILVFSIISVTHAVHPLNRLARKVKRITEGHYDERISISRYKDVVGRLQNSFAAMQDSLHQHVNDIQEMNTEAQKRNEELARTSELAKESDRQKSLFIQNVSHQIRTPLNIIMGFSQVIGESKAVLSEEEAKNITSMMRHNAMLIQRMVEMLFDSSTRGATEEVYAGRNDEVPCNQVANECIKRTKELFPDVNITLTSKVSETFCIKTNRRYLTITIREMLFNAAKYSDGQNISLNIVATDTTIWFIFEDTGPGINIDDSDRLFDIFTKVNDLSEGLGLGLALSKRHMKNLGGELVFDNSYTDGCRIILELPL